MFQKTVDRLSNDKVRVDETLEKFSQELKYHLCLRSLNHCHCSLVIISFNDTFVLCDLKDFLDVLLIKFAVLKYQKLIFENILKEHCSFNDVIDANDLLLRFLTILDLLVDVVLKS